MNLWERYGDDGWCEFSIHTSCVFNQWNAKKKKPLRKEKKNGKTGCRRQKKMAIRLERKKMWKRNESSIDGEKTTKVIPSHPILGYSA